MAETGITDDEGPLETVYEEYDEEYDEEYEEEYEYEEYETEEEEIEDAAEEIEEEQPKQRLTPEKAKELLAEFADYESKSVRFAVKLQMTSRVLAHLQEGLEEVISYGPGEPIPWEVREWLDRSRVLMHLAVQSFQAS